MSVLQGALAFVDIETSGLGAERCRIIEVAVIRVENGVITQTFRSLVDPQVELPYFITRLTGITQQDVRSAPAFHQIADELHQILDGAVFVAHNVRFDYSFLKQEFKRTGRQFLPKQLCTVKLSRALYPHERGHKLADLIQRHRFHYGARHRAYDDAAVLWQFIQHVQAHFPPEQVDTAIRQQLRNPAIPKQVEPELVKNLPETAGVYIFEDGEGQPLYIGKSINIRQRVLSHFGRDHAEAKEFKLAQATAHIRAEETAGELSALLLESRLIKELQPLYNRRLRRSDSLLLARQRYDSAGYAAVSLEEVAAIEAGDAETILAVYPRRGAARRSLEELTKTYDLCPKLMGLEKPGGACFAYQLHRCRGACVGAEPSEQYNERLRGVFERQRIHAWPYKGAVLVEEKLSPEVHGIVVDQWCVVAEITQDPDCEPVVRRRTKHFDLDTYKILQTFLSAKISTLKIQRVDLDALLAARPGL